MSSDSVKSKGGDIEIPANKMNEFFFMDSDEEQETYGAAAKVPLALAANTLKGSKQEAVSLIANF